MNIKMLSVSFEYITMQMVRLNNNYIYYFHDFTILLVFLKGQKQLFKTFAIGSGVKKKNKFFSNLKSLLNIIIIS